MTLTEDQTKDALSGRGLNPSGNAGKLYLKAITGPPAFATAVAAFCRECQGWAADSLQSVVDCQVSTCPLWQVRLKAISDKD